MQHTNMRKAIAMIELIFALVVMGIVMMSAPMLISSSVKSSVVALQQEGINEAVSRVNMILTYPWDERDTSDACIPPILFTAGRDSNLNATVDTDRRIGVPLATNSHSFACGAVQFAASPIQSDPDDNATKDDIDDFDGLSTLSNVGGAGGVDYIEKTTIKISNNISYISDATDYTLATVAYNAPPAAAIPAGTTTNIKQIAITLTSSSENSDLNKTIIFRAFSANVGGIEYEGRTF